MLQKILWYGLAIALVGVVVVTLIGCSQDPSAGLKNPFNTSMGYFSLNGYSSGYEPGNTYNMGFTLNNTDNETWQGKYSIYLIDSKEVVLNIVNQRPFTLAPQASVGSDFEMALPGSLQEGRYGIYVVFPGLLTSISTIYLGEEPAPSGMPARPGWSTPSPVDHWPDPGNLPQL